MVVGLRNPGPEFAGTRHNVGADAVERFLTDASLSLKRAPQGIRAEISDANVDGHRAVVGMPTTFMNESGQAVQPLVRYYGIDLSQILVVHDDIDVPFGKLKMQWARGHGGNNGVRSVAGSLKTPDFWRLKIGVGRPPGRMDPADFVLKRFKRSERPEIDVSVYRAAEVIGRFIVSGGEQTRQFTGELND
ncbi:MAG: aminoacyl-tRNA hydrolase [Acidimicrobiia bacterium]|nr:MAG: aminoacyl-tRNA hydrolase [Acidimicrobiia bacterium]